MYIGSVHEHPVGQDEPKPSIGIPTPDLPMVSKPPAAEFELRSSRMLLPAAHMTENMLRQSADALNFQALRARAAVPKFLWHLHATCIIDPTAGPAHRQFPIGIAFACRAASQIRSA